MIEFSAAERERAAKDLWERAWGQEEPQFRPKPDRWAKNLLDGLVTPLSARNTVALQCELNGAVELLREALHAMEAAGYGATGIRDFLSYYRLSAPPAAKKLVEENEHGNK